MAINPWTTSKMKLINDKLSRNKLKVYRTSNTFFLVTQDNEYQGHIEFTQNKK
jgi:hypothetical protein